METTGAVLDQHLRCFGENDLDGLVSDYSLDAVLFVPDRSLKGPQSNLFFRLSLRSLQILARRFRCGSDTSRVTTPTYLWSAETADNRTKLPPTRRCAGREDRGAVLCRQDYLEALSG